MENGASVSHLQFRARVSTGSLIVVILPVHTECGIHTRDADLREAAYSVLDAFLEDVDEMSPALHPEREMN